MFNHKYQPTRFQDLIFQNDVVRKRLEGFASGARGDNILLWGPFGTGKSLTASLIAKESRNAQQAMFNVPIDIVHCSQLTSVTPERFDLGVVERGWRMSGQKFPYAIMEEFDILSQAHSDVVRDIMDRNLGRAGFILTTNHIHRIDGAIQSRCEVIEMPSLSPEAMLPTCQSILKSEGVTLSDESLLGLIDSSSGDWRRLLRILEAFVNGVREKTAA